MPRKFNATIKDVAREAGVSYSTVSRVLNDYRYISPEKRQRVMAAVERLGYVVNLQARKLVGGRSEIVGLVIQELSNQYNGLVMQGIDEELARVGYELMLHTTHRHKDKEALFVKTLTGSMIDGLLLLLPLDPGSYLAGLREQHFPYVVIDHQGFDDFSPTVGADSWQGASSAVRYLIELGHRRIAFVAGQSVTSSALDRLAAYRAVLEKHGIAFDPALVQPGEYAQHQGFVAANALLDLPQPPTAIFAANDLSAIGVYEAIRSRGLRIPQDVSVVGFDDIPQAAYMHPALTTVRQPVVEIGRRAVRLLLTYINDPDHPTERVVLPTELVIRDSCQPPR